MKHCKIDCFGCHALAPIRRWINKASKNYGQAFLYMAALLFMNYALGGFSIVMMFVIYVLYCHYEWRGGLAWVKEPGEG